MNEFAAISLSKERSRPRLLAFAALGVLVVAAAIVILLSRQSSSTAPKVESSRPFARTSVWNAPLSANAPISPESDTLVSELKAQVTEAGTWIDTTQFSTPVYTVRAGQPKRPVILDTHGGSADALASELRTGVPIPQGAQAALGTDRHMVIWQPSHDTMWEFWEARQQNGTWHARWGGEMTHVSSNPGYFQKPPDWGATATSLPLLGGLIRTRELRAGHIDHALALAIPHAAAGAYTFPAQRSDGNDPNPTAIPEGTRFRLNPRLDVNGLHLPAVTKMLAVAAQRYGIIVRDQSGVVSFYAEDPQPTGANPYSGPHGLFQNQYPNNLLRAFPWQDLQVVRAPVTRR